MANNMVVGYNVGIPLNDIAFASTPITSANTARVTAFNPLRTYVPGRTINSLLTITKNEGLLFFMKTVADFTPFLATSVDNIVVPPGGETAVFSSQFSSQFS